jgi:D-serine deaminase-like pyridoxal phosphate-dependent protein
VLVAYPVCGPILHRIAELAANHPSVQVSVLCETLEAVAEVPGGLGIYVDLNTGMNRTGVYLDQEGHWKHAVKEMAERAGTRFMGIHSYEGHLQEAQYYEAEEGYKQVAALAHFLLQHQVAVKHVITSGSDTFGLALRSPTLTQLRKTVPVSVSPGICVFHDFKSDLLKPTTRGLEAAAVVMSRVVSVPCPGRCTLSAGSKSLDCASGEPVCWIAGRSPKWMALKPSEEHLPVDVSGGPAPVRGEIVWLITRHICCTINLAEKVVLLDDGGKMELAPVAARGHELGVEDMCQPCAKM